MKGENMEIDLEELRQEVMQVWDEDGIDYMDADLLRSYNLPDNGMWELTIKSRYADILEDVESCLGVLGFDTIADYMADKNGWVNKGVKTYQQYLDYLERNELEAPDWIKQWAKERLA